MFVPKVVVALSGLRDFLLLEKPVNLNSTPREQQEGLTVLFLGATFSKQRPERGSYVPGAL